MRITHPRPQLGRQRDLGIEFRDGVAVVDELHPERELALRQHGYLIEADPEVAQPYQAGLGEPIIDLETLTKAELRGMLPEDADVPTKASHAELVQLVSELPADPIPGSIANGDGSYATVEFSDGAVAEVNGEQIVNVTEPKA
ncbi:hypothetical protein M4D51_08000 [Microbacterium sp. p3-SID338]|uniref:hypothetical protein n=1 Tax=Microbacterium sp. p3-SID338 TaxID=2916214 RepID=UPI0021A889E7|nr:hypothetical protein [Microbacterium sp. p3-SID338]MCT1395667.1 hypothetical protein [Microbacterium sp. p3-SID338]